MVHLTMLSAYQNTTFCV